ncbi:MAG: hypothetical protein ACLFVJ_23655 [Persicimonas sp.]
MKDKDKHIIGDVERYRLAGTIARLVHNGSPSDVRVFCEDKLVCASYDRGRTLVLNSASREGVGLIETVQQVWRAAQKARRVRNRVKNA